MLTRQEMFNLAFNGIRNQNFEPAYDNGRCKYLTGDGKRCAFGHIQPTLSDETQGVYGVYDPNLISRIDLDFAEDLQTVHDYSAGSPALNTAAKKYSLTPYTMEYNLRQFAKYHNLTVPE